MQTSDYSLKVNGDNIIFYNYISILEAIQLSEH